MKKTLIFISMLFSIGFQTSVFAQVPVNDSCIAAIELTVGAACLNGTNVEAGTEVEFVFAENYFLDVWYKFTATSAWTKVSLTNAAPTIDAAVFVVENGCADPINNEVLRINVRFGEAGLDEIASFPTTVGTEYHIAVQGSSSSGESEGAFCMAVSETVEPPINDFLDITLVDGVACVQGTTVGANITGLPGIPTFYTTDVLYSFIATKDSATISLTNVGLNLDAAIWAFTFTNINVDIVGLSDVGTVGGTDETLTFATQKDSTYFILILGYETVNEDVFCIALTEKNVFTSSDLSATEVFSIFPNPTTENISIMAGSNTSFDAVILKDITGRNVLQAALTNQNSTIATASLNEGIYFIQLFNKDKLVGTSRFIKQ